MINKEKCNAWVDLILAEINISKELTDDEVKYIQAIFSKLYGDLLLEELKEKNNDE